VKVLVVHYHLRPGGVTTVIRHQLSTLASLGVDAAILSGEAPPSTVSRSGTVTVEPALGYDATDFGPEPRRVAAIADAIRREADALGEDTVIHVHNPTLRKNASFLPALAELAATGRRLLLHVHDLAEDWRPDVYSFAPYPDGVRWAAINRFDVEALRQAGASEVAFLPDPVPCPPPDRNREPARPRGPGLLLYPVRGIRRKNLGEAILLSMFARKGSKVGMTLPPTGQRNVARYDAWRSLAAELGAPIRFGIGLNHDFDALYAESVAVLTTSVKEGFGLSYLEPIARGRLTLGRRLPRVTADFEAAGLAFPDLYDFIATPRELFDEDSFARRVGEVMEKAADAYRYHGLEDGFARAVVDDILEGNGAGADFGRLDEEAQTEALRALSGDRRARSRFDAVNPRLEGWDAVADDRSPQPRECLAPWSEAAYGQRLMALYRDILERGGGAPPDKEALLGLYLRAEDFNGVGI
jgi:glycosyltransferase involved in cell wall biosynthesis